ncbi:MAG TPA: BTAD domain-containing putative transcriptional regulator [Pseudonocardiaceae bacterium]|nr:BTAD domain-containing putative transcriptional regulator [Pseudonocardiaceae bacterium]
MRPGQRDRECDPWQFTLLDSVSARRNNTDIALGPPQRRAVLAVLLINAGSTVGTETLIDAVWGDRPPGKAPATLQVHVSALRRALEADRKPHEQSRAIRSVDRGYLVDPDHIELDVFRFRREIAEADQARTRGDLTRATELLRSALTVFHSVALPGVPGPFAAQHRDMLVEQRLTAYLDLVELNLLSQPDAIVDHDLTELLAAHQYHERLLAMHIRLLHHNGRRADALAAYAIARRTLIADLGVEPGAELRRLQQRLLVGDAGGPVTAPRLVVGQRPATTSEPELGRPPRQPWLLGQGGVLAELIDALTRPVGRNAPVVVLHGMAGLGKTATAVWAAQETTDRFPGGRFFLPADADPEHSAAVLRRVERAGGALLIIDDVTPAADVRPELPLSPDVTVLITSRSRCRLLPLARRIGLPPLRPDSAGELFRTVVGGQRCDREPDAVRRLVSASAGVPSVLLSLADLLSRRPEWSITDYADRLDGDGDWSLDVHLRPLFDRGYAELDQLQAKVFRMAALSDDRPPTAASIAAMTTWPIERVELLLEDLVDRSMLSGLALGEYEFPPLLRRYGLERALRVETTDDLATARQRLATHLGETVTSTAGTSRHGSDTA